MRATAPPSEKRWTRWLAVVALLGGLAARPALATELGFKLPPGTRLVDGRRVVGSGLAEATRFLDRQLTKAGIAFERIGPYRVRGIEVTRFVSQQPSTPWLAIHLVRKEGRTFLDIVERTNPLTNPGLTR